MSTSRQEPRYSRIERELRARVARLSPGDQLPSDAMLCAEFGVSRATARLAMQRLVDEGLVERVRGFGTYVGKRGAGSPGDPNVVATATILTSLADHPELTVSELAHALGRPSSELSRLLEGLCADDLVEQGVGAGTYRLGLGVLRLASAVLQRFDVRRAALPVMEDLHRLSGETIYLCVRSGLAAVCIERLDGLRVQSMALRLGGSLPLHLGAAPRALLAFEPEELWEQYVVEAELRSMTPRSITSRAELFAALNATRRDGYAISDGDVVPGIATVGAPIFTHRGTLCAALSMGGAEQTILGDNRDESIRSVVEGAVTISRALGHDPSGQPSHERDVVTG